MNQPALKGHLDGAHVGGRALLAWGTNENHRITIPLSETPGTSSGALPGMPYAASSSSSPTAPRTLPRSFGLLPDSPVMASNQVVGGASHYMVRELGTRSPFFVCLFGFVRLCVCVLLGFLCISVYLYSFPNMYMHFLIYLFSFGYVLMSLFTCHVHS